MVTSRELTLLDVIQAVSEVATNDWETRATVVHLIRNGKVRLCHGAVRAIMDVVAMVNAAA
jgi:hypothetical protein